jgi:hypothetical protein
VDACGTTWRKRSSFLASSTDASRLTPVTFAPGRLRLATKPVLRGSAALTKTIGILDVAALTALAGSLPPLAKITAISRLIRSDTSAGNRS